MRIRATFIVASGLVCLLVAGGERTIFDSKPTRDLVWDIYASLYASRKLDTFSYQNFEAITTVEWPSKLLMVNSLLYLNEREPGTPMVDLQAMVDGDRIPHYEDAGIAAHIRALYERVNQSLGPQLARIQAPPIKLAAFLGIADKMDGKLDARVQLPHLDGLYHLLVEKAVPPAAIGYGFREGEAWADRRAVVSLFKLDRELPKALTRLRNAKTNDLKKMKKILRFIQKKVTPVEDGFGSDYWQTPYETLLVGEGDCEDFAILFHTIAGYLNVKTRVAVGYTWVKEPGGTMRREGHAWVMYQGQIIDPINPVDVGSRYQATIIFDADGANFVHRKSNEPFKTARMASL
jgi:predicted transglutaminase-like cysteine proteinase